ncbi:inositol monophosphatase [Patescibacteria group bacterium]|nr:inositol monophosphatase [Patescibacteria group bacterium]
MTLEQKFHTLVQLVETLGQQARAYFDDNQNTNEQKTDGSIVTQIDKDIEDALVDFIRTEFPDDTIIGEEGEGFVGTSDFVWHIDPIDGTDNFLRRIPFCAISVARLGSTTEDSFGIVHNPITNQTFAALMDNGVYEREHVHVLTDELLGGRAVVSIGRGREQWMKSAAFNLFKAIGTEVGKPMILNCTALELAYIAANRIDGVLNFGEKSYDYAAGLFLVKAAGGQISVFEHNTWSPWIGSLKELCAEHGKTMFISHGGIHTKAIELIGNPRDWSDEK